MLTMVIVLATAAVIGVYVHRTSAAQQPATERDRTHRAEATTGPDVEARAPGPAVREPSAAAGLVPGERTRRQEARASARTPWWRRVVAVVELVLLIAVVGVAVAAVVGALALVAASLLGGAID